MMPKSRSFGVTHISHITSVPSARKAGLLGGRSPEGHWSRRRQISFVVFAACLLWGLLLAPFFVFE